VIARSGLFDREWYLKNNPVVAAWGIDPIRHYVDFGAREGRDPSPSFSTRAYLSHNRDVAAAGVNPFLHFLLHRAAEGRARGISVDAVISHSLVHMWNGPAAGCFNSS
jgi:hypothetical protein